MTEVKTPKIRPKTERAHLKTVARGGGIGLVGRIAITIFNMVLQVMLARTLGTERIGLLNLALVTTNIATMIALFGMGKTVVRFVARYIGEDDYEKLAGTFRSSAIILLVTSFIVTGGLWLSRDFWVNSVYEKPELGPILAIVIWCIPFTVFSQLFVSIAQGYKRIDHRVAIEQIAIPLLKIIGAGAVIIWLGTHLVGIATALLVASVIGAVLGVLSFWKLLPRRRLAGVSTKTVTGPMLAFTAPLALLSVINRLDGNVEALILGRLSTAEQVGIFTLALKPAAFISLWLIALTLIFAPLFTELYTKGDHDQMASLFKTVTKWAIVMAMPVFLIVFDLSVQVMAVFGRDFEAGFRVTQMMAVSKLVLIATGPSATILTMSGHPNYNLFNTIASLTVSIALDFLLIPTYGAMGAAVGITATFLIHNLLSVIQVYWLLGIHPYNRSSLKPFIAGGLALLAGNSIKGFLPASYLWQFISVSLVMLVCYVLIMLALGIDDEDRFIINTVRRRLFRAGGRNSAK